MDYGSKQISMEKVDVPHLHEHPLVPFTRFALGRCEVCTSRFQDYTIEDVLILKSDYIYGGFRCNELGCESAVFHKDCVKTLSEINHSSHPDHPLKLIINLDSEPSTCLCGKEFKVGYCCSICDFKLDLECARRPEPLFLPEDAYGHEHPLKLCCEPEPLMELKYCKVCQSDIISSAPHYRCQRCEYFIHVDCVDLFPEAYHTSHPQHPLKSLKRQAPDYADKKCLLCSTQLDGFHHQLHHCGVCDFSICRRCVKNPPPVVVESWTTHKHQLYLVPRLIDFTCNACGTHGDRSPYFCLQCNFMVHRECIGLPHVININRHNHRISYTPHLGEHRDWKCKVCREDVSGFYGAYTCSKCPRFSVHLRCATSKRVWDMVELEGTPEEEIIAPYDVIDNNTIKHFSHDHNLQINESGRILPESTLCEACVFQICSEPFYNCKQCEFILHKKCANLAPKIRHVRNNQPFKLQTDSLLDTAFCQLCRRDFTGFRYKSGPDDVTIDVQCASISDSLAHESHPHLLYYYSYSAFERKHCNICGNSWSCVFRCDECDFILDGKCALLPEKVMKNRYDDHPLFLSYGDINGGEIYWCEACETKVDSKKGFYTCNDCGVVLHISCVVGDLSYIKPGSFISCHMRPNFIMGASATSSNEEVVSNASICRPICCVCNSRCKLPSILKLSKPQVDVYFCTLECRYKFRK